MNAGPYRAPQPADRRVINRSESAPYRQPDEPQQPVARDEPQPRAASRSVASSRKHTEEKSSKKGAVWTVILVILALIIGGVGGYVGSRSFGGGGAIAIDDSKYQAVYLMNGQLYFGKLSRTDDTHLKLTNVYYLQAKTADSENEKGSLSSDASSASNFQLIKLANAIYGPSDEMIISEDQVLYYQNLNNDSRASQLIENDR